MFTRTKEVDLASLDTELASLQQKVDELNEQIAQIDRTSEHRIYTREDSLKSLDKARDRLRAAKEQPIEEDPTREIERVTYLQTLEREIAQLESDVPAHLERLQQSLEADEQKRITLHAEISELQARGAELVAQRMTLQRENDAKHQAAGEQRYKELIARFNNVAKWERTLVFKALEAKQCLLKKNEESTQSLASWPTLARRFQDETAHIIRMSQAENLDSSEQSLELARARRTGGMVIDRDE